MLFRLLILFCLTTLASAQSYPATDRYTAIEAFQAVAVDPQHFYAIDNAQIGKYDKSTGERVAHWQAAKDHTFVHMNSGVVVDGKLYCAHSTWPHGTAVNLEFSMVWTEPAERSYVVSS